MLPTPITTAYLLAEDDSSLELDRKVLRRLGIINMIFFASGRKALDQLQLSASTATAANGPVSSTRVDILIIAERLDDMTGLQFLSHVRASSPNATIPALFLVNNAESTVALAPKASGSCAVLARPYSPEQAQEALHQSAMAEYRAAPLVLPPSFINSFAVRRNRSADTPILRRGEKPKAAAPGETALREGVKALQRGDTVMANSLLHGSYDADPGRVETCLALSKLYAFLHKENMELMRLCRAGVLCLKRGETHRARELFSRLPRGRAGQTPLLAEAGLVLQSGEAKAAALAFMEAYRLDPSQPLHALIGRTCMFTPAPEEHIRGLVRALNTAGHNATANKLHWRLLQPPKEEEAEEHSFLENFPILRDIVSVAAHTFKTWATRHKKRVHLYHKNRATPGFYFAARLFLFHLLSGIVPP
jgi:CheY-like chemotaxis protein